MKNELASDLHPHSSATAFERQLQDALTCTASDEEALELGNKFFAEFLLMLQDLMNCCSMGSRSNSILPSKDANSIGTDQLEDPFKTPVRFHRRLKPTFVAESTAADSPVESSAKLKGLSNSPFVESTVFSSALDEAIFNRAVKTPTKELAEKSTLPVDESAQVCTLPLPLFKLAQLHFSCSTLHHCRDLWTSVKAIFVFLQCEKFELLPGYSNCLGSTVSFDAKSIRQYGLLALKLHQPILQHLPASILTKALKTEHFLMLGKGIAVNASVAQAHAVPKSCSPNDSDFSIPISLSADSKRHLKTSMQIQTFSNQQKIRDDFFDIVRSFLPNFSGEFGELGPRVRQLQEKIHHQNMHWFAGVFVEEYINVCFVNRASNLSSFPVAATSNLEKMQKLESRFSIRGNDEFSVVFMGKELFFVKFMQAFDSLSFSEGLLKQFFAKLLLLATSILKKRATFAENWQLLKGISKAISSFSPNALTHAFILDSWKGIFDFCCKNSFRFFFFSQLSVFFHICEALKVSISPQALPAEWFQLAEAPEKHQFVPTCKTKFYLLLLQVCISKATGIPLTTSAKENLPALEEEQNFAYQPDSDGQMLPDEIICMLFPELLLHLTNFTSLQSTDSKFPECSQTKSPTRKIRPHSKPFSPNATASLATITNSNNSTQQHESIQAELRRWFLWKHFKIKEFIDCVTHAVVDNLVEAFVQTTTEPLEGLLDAAVTDICYQLVCKCREIYTVLFPKVFHAEHAQIISISVAIALEASERQIVARITSLLEKAVVLSEQEP